ncbi:hypothetical protein [Micromonospora sp. NPDC005237]
MPPTDRNAELHRRYPRESATAEFEDALHVLREAVIGGGSAMR